MRLVLLLLLLAADPMVAAFTALREADLRLAGIAHRLVTANVALCPDRAAAWGMPLQAMSQFTPATREAARAVFGFAAPVVVEGVVPDGPAARAGVRAGDGLLAVGGAPLPPARAATAATSDERDVAQALLSAASTPAALLLLRDGRRLSVQVAPTPACRSAFELLPDDGWTAQADGEVVQISTRYLEFDDAAVAAIAAHELAHNILRHRARLDAAGVKRGLLSEVGRNGRLFRAVEEEADRLSVYLLHNAGYDPAAGARFWREHGGKVAGGLFRSRTHYGPNTRAAQIEEEVAKLPRQAKRPVVPALLEARDRPL